MIDTYSNNRAERRSVVSITPGTIHWAKAMANANNASNNFVPLLKRTRLSKEELKYLKALLKAKYAHGREKENISA